MFLLRPTAYFLSLSNGWNAFGVLSEGRLAGFDASGLAAVRFSHNTYELVIVAANEPVRMMFFVENH